MLSGKPPWHGLEAVQIIYYIGTSVPPKYQLPDSVSDVAKNFLERCFISDPVRRPSADALLSDTFVCSADAV